MNVIIFEPCIYGSLMMGRSKMRELIFYVWEMPMRGFGWLLLLSLIVGYSYFWLKGKLAFKKYLKVQKKMKTRNPF